MAALRACYALPSDVWIIGEWAGAIRFDWQCAALHWSRLGYRVKGDKWRLCVRIIEIIADKIRKRKKK